MTNSTLSIISYPTIEQPTRAFIGCAPGNDPRASRESAWFITTKPDEAYAFPGAGSAREFWERLREGEAHGLRSGGRLWYVGPKP